MKKNILTVLVFLVTFGFASAQILPTFQIGLKAGVNLASLQTSAGATFSGGNQAGYLGGLWMRFGAIGFNFQPELYLTAKDVTINQPSGQTTAKFTSIDMPLLVGGKFGALGLGGRFYTGPVVSFAVDKQQGLSNALGQTFSLNYQDQNFAWQFGAGLDIKKISVDLRYEAGITKQSYGDQHTRISLFNLSLAYSLVKL